MAQETVKVKFFPGNGTEVFVDVSYIASYARDAHGNCAFCHGDPCAENKGAIETDIGRYFASCTWAEYCPMCSGQPT